MTRHLVSTLAVLALAGFACASVATPSAPQPSVPDTPVLPTEFVPTVVTITPTYEGCGYVWATQDLPNLTRKLNAALQKISLDVTGLAYAYGEDCVYADGHSTFSAMETDYRVGVKIKNMRDEGALGDWIARVMPVIDSLPPEEIAGPQIGRVDFDFKQPDPAELFVTVPIEKYRSEGKGLKGAELLHLFYTPPNPPTP